MGLPEGKAACKPGQEEGGVAAASPPAGGAAARRAQAGKRLLGSPAFRRGAQTAVGTAIVMAICSPPAVFNALSLDPIMSNPSLILVRHAMHE